MCDTELWKDILGYKGLYQVSNIGNIRGLKRNHYLKHNVTNLGYHRVCLCKNNKKRNFFIHRLVWEAFNGKIPQGMQINHLDENPSNNCLDNLSLTTPKENTNWGTAIERRAHSKQKKICQMTLDDKVINIYKSLKEASEKTKIAKGNISSCCHGGRHKSPGGFKWKYVS